MDVKKYIKPDLFYESFELNQHIADCSAPLNHTENTCALDSSEAPDLFLGAGETIFASGNGDCRYTLEQIGYEDYCYWTGKNTTNIFTS